MALGRMEEPTASGSGSEQPISTKVLDAGMNAEAAWARVGGWIGSENHPRQWVEDQITVVFQTELDSLRAETAQEGRPYEITWDPDRTPRLRLLEPRDEEDVLAKLTELKRVALEAVVEAATTRVVRRLRGIEWRDPEEIALERVEAERAE